MRTENWRHDMSGVALLLRLVFCDHAVLIHAGLLVSRCSLCKFIHISDLGTNVSGPKRLNTTFGTNHDDPKPGA